MQLTPVVCLFVSATLCQAQMSPGPSPGAMENHGRCDRERDINRSHLVRAPQALQQNREPY
jgi:hypothetical protein